MILTALVRAKPVAWLLIGIFWLGSTFPVLAQPADEASVSKNLTVHTIERPPFMMLGADEAPTGFSIELWQAISTKLGWSTTYVVESQFSDMLAHVRDGTADLAIANISITSERERLMDFSQPIFDSGLRILVSTKSAGIDYWALVWESGIMQMIGLALLILLAAAHVMWLFERGGHAYFRRGYLSGVWDAFWWAFIIVTMGGFERERPERILGRIFAIFWILAGLFFISTFTAKITTALTVGQLRTGIQSYQDLNGKKVGIAQGTTMEKFARSKGLAYIPYKDLSLAIKAVEKGEIDATIGDAPVVQYYASHQGIGKVEVVGELFAPDKIGILFPQNSTLREPVDRVLLELLEDGTYTDLYQRYFNKS